MLRYIGDYHFSADPDSGMTFRWGKTLDEDPIFSPVPELADISISNRCSKGCSFCYKDSTPEGKQMSIDEYRQVLDSLQSPEYGSVFQIAIGGGEPLEHPDFLQIVEETVRRGIVLNFTTNGQLITNDVCSALKGKVGAMAISASSIHELKRIKPAIDCAKGLKVNIHYILNRTSIEEATTIVNGAYNDLLKGINALVFLTYKPAGRGSDTHLLQFDAKTKAFVNAIKSPQTSFKIGFDACFIPMLLRGKAVRNEMVDTCEGGFFSVYIDENMRVSPCSFSGGRDSYSLKEFDFYDIWLNKLQPYRDRVKNDCKRDCHAREMCRGCCPYYPQITSCYQI